MDKKIAALLNNNLRVIIPDFGAFIIRQQQPRIVVFNEALTNNDGLLTEYIIKTESLEKELAEQLLSDYTNQAKRVLESGGIFLIEGIGELQHDRHRKIVFKQEQEVNVTDNAQNAQEETVKPVRKKKAAAKPRAKPPVKPVPDIVPDAAEPEKVKEVIPTTNTVTENSASEIPEPAMTADVPTRFFSRQMIRWILVFVLANFLILAFFIFKDNFRHGVKEAKEPFLIADSVIKQLADSVRVAAADTSMVFGENASVTPLDSSVLSDGNLRYYIVAGCFRDEINADELVKSLDSMGYHAEKFGKIGDLYAVSFASFDDKDLAVKELARIREEFHPDAWMTRF